MSGMAETTYPVPEQHLAQIAEEVCEEAFGDANDYHHESAEQWNHNIINGFLKQLVSASSSESSSSGKKYKYAVTSTVIQHLDAPHTSEASTSTTDDGTSVKTEETNGDVAQRPTSGRRGMHSATGAYWNNETDGMWTYKWDGAEKRGSDVVISVIWVQA